LHRDFQRVKKYFPPSERRGVNVKWKEITKKLHYEKAT
jgi:hypothetical protein